MVASEERKKVEWGGVRMPTVEASVVVDESDEQ